MLNKENLSDFWQFWDPRTPGTALGTVQLPERVFCSDVVSIQIFHNSNNNIHWLDMLQ